ncbi:site-specific DNA-methyltransferase [Micromonospora taraxaci]|uniref:DNA-methyltransferase n=1 Tax=Micromonospora taraxaci TaxID=1316803 RepID=UPI0033C59357
MSTERQQESPATVIAGRTAAAPTRQVAGAHLGSPEIDPDFTVHVGDARRLGDHLRELGAKLNPAAPDKPFLTATITSPPYASLVDYGVADQIGFGQKRADYLKDMQDVFRTLYDWTNDRGSLWLVVDTFLDQTKAPSALYPLPFELSALAQAVGWTLRDVVIWKKDKTRPWSQRGRLRNVFEYVLFLVKTSEFEYNVDRIRDATDLARWWVRYPERYNPQGKVPDNVWDIPIPVQGSWGTQLAHACPLPVELVRRIILLSSNPGDVVCDPFAGVGTVAATAEGMGRRGWGLELNDEFQSTYRAHLRPQVLDQLAHEEAHVTLSELRETVLSLRAVKYPKALVAGLRKEYPGLPRPAFAAALAHSPTEKRNAHQLLEVTTLFVLPPSKDSAELRAEMEEALKLLSCRAPLTKYGIAGDIAVVERDEFVRRLGPADLWIYENGRTWTSSNSDPIDASRVFSAPLAPVALRGHYPPIFANVKLQLIDDGRLPAEQQLGGHRSESS